MSTDVITGVNAYLDGELGPDEAAEVEALLDKDPAAKAAYDFFSQQKTQLSQFIEALNVSSHSLRTAHLERQFAVQIQKRSTPYKAYNYNSWIRATYQLTAACAFAAFGWLGHSTWSSQQSRMPDFVSEAIGAHMVFANDMDHPVEFTGDAINDATEWFTRKIGVPIEAPDLTAEGMDLVGSRLLGTHEGALAQFIYEHRNGLRYSLTLSRHLSEEPALALAVGDYGGGKVAYWTASDIDYALVGEDPTSFLETLVHRLDGS